MDCQAMYKCLDPDFVHKDFRGTLVQLIHSGYQQVNVLTSRKGVIRGNHYHKKSVEAFYIIQGSVDVIFGRENESAEKHFESGAFFQIYPNVQHTMRFPEDCVMLQLYDRHIESSNGEKDIYYE
jgi:dTDP-4-dehydrorhamnose 3,5-epimerase-like enzyme